MDLECAELCRAINLMPGIETVESCCGHGERPYRIWFMADSLDCLPNLIYWFAACHCGYYDWRVIVKTGCAKEPAVFCVEGPKGMEAYVQASIIARLIETDALMVMLNGQ